MEKRNTAAFLIFVIFSVGLSIFLSFSFPRLKNYFLDKFFFKSGFPSAIIKITIPEGFTVKQISERFARFKNFNTDNFFRISEGKEGYLFPDTYFFNSFETEDEIVKLMEDNFKAKAGAPSPEIVVMASILEREAVTFEDKKIVAGILWKRIEVGMPLQVDAVFSYIIGKKSSELTLDDLKIDSPYNTYLYKGLPPAPICNPGLESIMAAIDPSDSPYWYYLSDKKCNIHFAENFDEHKFNKAKYLR